MLSGVSDNKQPYSSTTSALMMSKQCKLQAQLQALCAAPQLYVLPTRTTTVHPSNASLVNTPTVQRNCISLFVSIATAVVAAVFSA